MIILLIGVVVAFIALRFVYRDNKVAAIVMSLLIMVVAVLGSTVLNTMLTKPTITRRELLREEKLQSFDDNPLVYAYTYNDPQRPLAHIIKVAGSIKPRLIYEAEVKKGDAKLVTEKVTKHYNFTLWFLPITESKKISTIFKPANAKIVNIE